MSSPSDELREMAADVLEDAQYLDEAGRPIAYLRATLYDIGAAIVDALDRIGARRDELDEIKEQMDWDAMNPKEERDE